MILDRLGTLSQSIPDRLAILGVTERRRTYTQLYALALTASEACSDHFEVGSRILVECTSASSTVCLAAGVVDAGGVPVLVPRGATTWEVSNVATAVGASAIVRLTAEDRTEVSAFASPRNVPRSDSNADPSVVLVTSGSTGNPKAVVHNLATFVPQQVFAPDEAWLSAYPPSSVAGLTCVSQTVLAAGTLAQMSRFWPRQFLAAIGEYAIGIACLPAQLAPTLCRVASAAPEVPSPKMIALGGGPVAAGVVRELRRLFRCDVVVSYGTTELGGGALFSVDDIDDVPDDGIVSLRPIGDFKPSLHLQSGRGLHADAEGSLRVRTPSQATGLLQEGVFVPLSGVLEDGSVETGDIARVRPDGAIEILGRHDDLVIRNGLNVYPAEVERVASLHPSVLDVHVAAIRPGDTSSEMALLYQPLEPGVVTPKELRRHIRSLLSGDKVPEIVLEVDRLPRDPNGKVSNRALRAALGGEEANDHGR